MARRGEQRRLDKASHAGQLSRFLPGPGASCLATVAPAALETVITGWQVPAWQHARRPPVAVSPARLASSKGRGLLRKPWFATRRGASMGR